MSKLNYDVITGDTSPVIVCSLINTAKTVYVLAAHNTTSITVLDHLVFIIPNQIYYNSLQYIQIKSRQII